MLALCAKMTARPPKQRVEPIDGARKFCDDLNEPVETFNVREFVSEHNADAILGPCLGLTRKQNARSEAAKCSEDAAFTLQHSQRPSDPERSTQFGSNTLPAWVHKTYRTTLKQH